MIAARGDPIKMERLFPASPTRQDAFRTIGKTNVIGNKNREAGLALAGKE